MTYSEIGLLMSYQLAGKWVRPKVSYYAYAHSHTRCSRTGSDRQLKHSCRLGHSPFREAKTLKRVEKFFGFSKFWISADKRRSCVISNAVFGALFKFLAPSKNIHRGGHDPRPPPCQHATAFPYTKTCHTIFIFMFLQIARCVLY